MANNGSHYALIINAASPEECHTIGDKVKLLLMCRWGGSQWVHVRRQGPPPEDVPFSQETFDYTQPKFFIGRAKLEAALGSLYTDGTVTFVSMSAGMTVEQVQEYEQVKREFGVPDVLPESDTSSEADFRDRQYGKRARR